ncbi:hypothetical protein L1987_40607 [Smallanthus sonchifolius]|uniref:Uncharacterized protein n=1 Tax=Smallanthus sonchifolius TaxID=185202 RepID=A0ACB9GT45_9ASTR|nr:hypothetical protein L1987_40607 [Smallanthus sonchifolius]
MWSHGARSVLGTIGHNFATIRRVFLGIVQNNSGRRKHYVLGSERYVLIFGCRISHHVMRCSTKQSQRRHATLSEESKVEDTHEDEFVDEFVDEIDDESIDEVEEEYVPSLLEEFGDELVDVPTAEGGEFDPLGDLAELEALLYEEPTREMEEASHHGEEEKEE